MRYFDKNGVLIRPGVEIFNKEGHTRKVVLAVDRDTIGLVPLNIENWNINMGVEPLESIDLNEWSIKLDNYNTKYYHVTLAENLNNILQEGLIPLIGERSLEIEEKEALVYLFSSIEDMECAVMQWLGDWYKDKYGEDVKLISLKIDLPPTFPIENREVEYESVSRDVIPPKYISFFKYVS